MKKAFRAAVQRAKERADKLRERGKDSGKAGALPPQPKEPGRRNKLTRKGWKPA